MELMKATPIKIRIAPSRAKTIMDQAPPSSWEREGQVGFQRKVLYFQFIGETGTGKVLPKQDRYREREAHICA
jgi:hypothetical protein